MDRRFFELILAVKRKCQCNEEQMQAELGLAPAEFNGLLALEDGRALPGCEFARRMGLSPSRGSRVLSVLLTHGYVRTQCSPDDRRVIRISLTGKGKQMRAGIIERMQQCEERVIGKLDQRGRGQVVRALELLDTVL